MEICTVWIGLLILALLALLWHLTKYHGTLEALGIPVIRPFLFLGSPPFALHKVKFHEWILDNHKKFGPTWGHYEGISPCIYTIDPELLKDVLVKHFDSFSDSLDYSAIADKHLTLDLSGGHKWKALRKILSPTFTSGKLKTMMEPMTEVADKTLAHFEELARTNPKVAIKGVFQGYALDTIARCAFGIETNSHKEQDCELIKAGREVLQGIRIEGWGMTMLMHLFTYFPGCVKYIPGFIPEAFNKLYDITESIIQQREKQNIQKGDFIDRIKEIRQNPEDPITKELITAQGIIFFAAGFETTSNTLSTLCYQLAKHPEIQEKLYQEIQDVLAKHEVIDHETINEMHYLEACINENLRINGPVTVHIRMCIKDCQVHGMKIKKGTQLRLPIFASHSNPDFFPEPDKFKPERFIKKNQDDLVPMTFRPFGYGPRVCIGQRFAMSEMKICMAKLLDKFKIGDLPETKLDILNGDQFLLTYPDFKVKLELRHGLLQT